ATSTLFRVLGTRPALGRFFLASEDVPPRGTSVAVLSYRLWMSEFGGDRGVLGHQISLDGDEYTVVGVAPRGFSGVERAPVDVWLPMSTCCRGNLPTWATTWNASRVRLVGRLRPTADVRLADTQMTAALRHGYSGHNPLMHEATVSARPLGYTDDGVEPREAGVSRVLYALSILMLLVAAANIANWLVVRAVRRRRELGIRRALGAGRARVARLLLTEALGLAVLGGIAGLLVGDWSGTLIGRALFPGIPWTSLPFDGRILACTAAAVLLTALLIGMLPPLRATRDDLRSCLSGGESVSRGRGRRVRTVLQAAQVALAVILLSTTGLFVRSLLRIRDLDLGVQVDRVVVAHIDLPEVEVHTPAERQRADVTAQTRFNALLDAVRRLPGVERASVEAGSVPFFQAVTVPIRPAGRSAMPAASGGGPYISAVSADYFRTVGTPTIRGRVFRSSEGYGTEPVAVVNETMARVVWPGENALGQCLVIQPRRAPRCVRVVGVAADAHQSGLRETPPMQVYVPFGQELPEESSALLVRPIGDAEAFVHTLRTALSRAAPDAHVWDVSLLGSSLQPQIRPWRVGTLVFGLFGIATLAIAGVGLFTVMAYLVAQQQHELGVRIALGARRRQILWMVWKRALVTSVVGTGVGVLGALAIAPVVQPLLFQGSARDPVLLTMVALVLALTAMAASMMPALRACRVDPVLVLRGE
ncbi:MAG TPA: FtsX-like permease family protein, partial [Gemmatimonadaceae bacterium]|nr:FtsX-like permease family protein [Gemmatimonadaceae bacterium]